MSEALECPDHVVRSGILLTKSQQNGDLELALASIGGMILEYFDSHYVIAAVTKALHNLTECTLAQELQHLDRSDN